MPLEHASRKQYRGLNCLPDISTGCYAPPRNAERPLGPSMATDSAGRYGDIFHELAAEKILLRHSTITRTAGNHPAAAAANGSSGNRIEALASLAAASRLHRGRQELHLAAHSSQHERSSLVVMEPATMADNASLIHAKCQSGLMTDHRGSGAVSSNSQPRVVSTSSLSPTMAFSASTTTTASIVCVDNLHMASHHRGHEMAAAPQMKGCHVLLQPGQFPGSSIYHEDSLAAAVETDIRNPRHAAFSSLLPERHYSNLYMMKLKQQQQQQRQQQEMSSSSRGMYRCNLCPMSFRSPQALGGHKGSHRHDKWRLKPSSSAGGQQLGGSNHIMPGTTQKGRVGDYKKMFQEAELVEEAAAIMSADTAADSRMSPASRATAAHATAGGGPSTLKRRKSTESRRSGEASPAPSLPLPKTSAGVSKQQLHGEGHNDEGIITSQGEARLVVPGLQKRPLPLDLNAELQELRQEQLEDMEVATVARACRPAAATAAAADAVTGCERSEDDDVEPLGVKTPPLGTSRVNRERLATDDDEKEDDGSTAAATAGAASSDDAAGKSKQAACHRHKESHDMSRGMKKVASSESAAAMLPAVEIETKMANANDDDNVKQGCCCSCSCHDGASLTRQLHSTRRKRLHEDDDDDESHEGCIKVEQVSAPAPRGGSIPQCAQQQKPRKAAFVPPPRLHVSSFLSFWSEKSAAAADPAGQQRVQVAAASHNERWPQPAGGFRPAAAAAGQAGRLHPFLAKAQSQALFQQSQHCSNFDSITGQSARAPDHSSSPGSPKEKSTSIFERLSRSGNFPEVPSLLRANQVALGQPKGSMLTSAVLNDKPRDMVVLVPRKTPSPTIEEEDMAFSQQADQSLGASKSVPREEFVQTPNVAVHMDIDLELHL